MRSMLQLRSECDATQQLNFKELDDGAVCTAPATPSASYSSLSLCCHGKTTTVPHGKLSGRHGGCRFNFCSLKMIGYMTFYLMTLFGWPLLCFVQPASGSTNVVPEISVWLLLNRDDFMKWVHFEISFHPLTMTGGGTLLMILDFNNFTVNQRRFFIDNRNSEPFFHQLRIDPHNASSLYVGALDFVYRLNADNINITFERSENITNFSNFSKIYLSAVDTCRNSIQRKPHPDYQCRNHIRGILPTFNEKEIYVCATGSYSPQDFYLNRTTLKVQRISYDPNYADGAGSGITKCPYDPDTNHTIVFVEANRGMPKNLSAIYSSLLVGAGFNYAIYRSSLPMDPNSRIEFSTLRSENGPVLGELSYIASFEIDQYIYFFFREFASESSNCGHSHYSRVARVCKNDKGGTLEKKVFLTYVKARLDCSVKTKDIPVYYNEIYDVQYDSVNRTFYGLFMANDNGMWGSAVCRYNYSTIVDKFEKEMFYAQETTNSEWTITSENVVPKPRPSLCLNDTELLTIPVQSFALTHTLMYGAVQQMTNSPLYYTRDVTYSHLAVDVVREFTVLYLYSVSAPDEIVCVVQWLDDGQQVKSRKLSVLKPFINGTSVSVLQDMKIHSVNGRKWLYATTENSVIQLSLDLCSSYTLCTDCVKDPHCGWDISSSQCQSFQSGLIQGVRDESSVAVCQSGCRVEANSKVIPGTAIHLSCSSHCSPEGDVTWTFQPSGSLNQVPVPVMSHPNYVLSWNNGLVVLNITRHHIGTFRCVSNGVTLAEQNVTASGCEYGEDVREIWIREFVNWCRAFDQYESQYNTWLCLKEKCLKTSCVSREAIESCSKR